jgi:hypothetical protein
MEETTLVKCANVWIKGQRNKNIISKNSTLTSPKSVLHAYEEGHKSD